MARFLSYRDGGKTDEKGISQHLYGILRGEVLNGLSVTQSSPLGMSVDVSKGRCMIDSGSDYPYLGFTDSIETVTISPADGSNPRIDVIVAYIDIAEVDSTNSNNPDAFKIVPVDGTPAGSPNPPNAGAIESAIGLGNPYIILARVTVGAGVTTITTGNVSNQRVMATVADNLVRTNSIQNGAITTAKIGTAQVKSSNIDFATLGAKIGVISGATLNSTGTKDITGLGFRPRVVRFTILWPPSTNLGSGGFGAAVSNVEQYAYAWGVNVSGGGSTRTNRTDSCIVAIGATSSTPQLRVSYTQSLADGFRLNVITAESIDVVYEAFQ